MLPAISNSTLDRVKLIESKVGNNLAVTTYHTLHSGVYTRTVVLEPNVLIVGALIRIPTTLIVSGDIDILISDKFIRYIGTKVLLGSANRKQVMIAREKTTVIMVFQTEAKTIEEAENTFTLETEALVSRQHNAVNYINIGEL